MGTLAGTFGPLGTVKTSGRGQLKAPKERSWILNLREENFRARNEKLEGTARAKIQDNPNPLRKVRGQQLATETTMSTAETDRLKRAAES